MKKILCIFSIFIFAVSNVLSCEAETVVFNTKTGKYHSPSCKWAKKCTVNCIKTEKNKAIKKGGVPCKVCGG